MPLWKKGEFCSRKAYGPSSGTGSAHKVSAGLPCQSVWSRSKETFIILSPRITGLGLQVLQSHLFVPFSRRPWSLFQITRFACRSEISWVAVPASAFRNDVVAIELSGPCSLVVGRPEFGRI